MSFTRVQGREEAATEETSSHNALSAAYALGYPFQVLTWGKSRFKLNMLQEVKSVAVKNVKTCAGGLYEIIQLFLLHPGCRSGPNIQSQLTWYHGSTGLSLSRTRKKGACFTSRGACGLFPFWAAIQGACQGIQQTVVCLWANESRTREEPPPERRPAATPAWRVLLRSSVLQ